MFILRRYELSDEQWDQIKDVFPVSDSNRVRPDKSHQLMFNGILWVLFSGAAWRDLPDRFGPWKTVYDRFHRWQEDGTFDKILKTLQLKMDEEGLLDWSTWFVDSTSSRAHKSAAGARKKSPIRSRCRAAKPSPRAIQGGFGANIYLNCDKNGIPLNGILSPFKAMTLLFLSQFSMG
ncbi:MAG: IS5 family transposase [Bacteroidota bacterium]